MTDEVDISGGVSGPVGVLDAGTQGMIGYLIQQELRSFLPREQQVATLRIRSETRASLPVLVLAIVAGGAVFVTFVFTTLIHEPASIATLAGILVLSVALDYGWKHFRGTRTKMSSSRIRPSAAARISRHRPEELR